MKSFNLYLSSVVFLNFLVLCPSSFFLISVFRGYSKRQDSSVSCFSLKTSLLSKILSYLLHHRQFSRRIMFRWYRLLVPQCIASNFVSFSQFQCNHYDGYILIAVHKVSVLWPSSEAQLRLCVTLAIKKCLGIGINRLFPTVNFSAIRAVLPQKSLFMPLFKLVSMTQRAMFNFFQLNSLQQIFQIVCDRL